MARKNIASGNDRVAVQAGRVTDGKPQKKSGKSTDEEPGSVTNVCTGDARVGVQAHTITGGLTVSWER
jgi:hypothetical protein